MKLLLESTANRNVPEYLHDDYQRLMKIIDKLNISDEKKAITKTVLHNSMVLLPHVRRLHESVTHSAGIAPLETYIFPILTRAMVRTFADQLVSVQPVQSTLAMVRILKTVYGTSKGKIKEGEFGLQTFASKNVVFSPYYTSPYVDGEPWTLAGLTSGTDETYKLAFPIAGKLTIQASVQGSAAETLTLEIGGSAAFSDSGSLSGVTASLDAAGTVTLSPSVDVTGPIDIQFIYTTSLEANKAPSIDLQLEKIDISVEVRRLFSAATVEAILELSAHGIDWESTMGEVLSGELAVELDRSIIQDIISQTIAAGYVDTFDNTLPSTWNRPATEFIKNLYFKIMQVNAKIFDRTRRIPGNWIVCSAKTAAALEAGNYIVVSDNLVDEYSGFGFYPLGVLRGLRNKVFVDVSRSFPDDIILVGAKGNSPYDAGYVYAPYAPAIPILTSLMDIEVPAGTLYVGVYQAAGFRMVDNGFYHIIKLTKSWDDFLAYA